MINHFIFSELLLYVLPVVVVYLLKTKYHFILDYFKEWPLKLYIVLLPLWMVLIRSFSVLIFGYSLLNLSIFISIYVLFVHLFFYIREIDQFRFKEYYLEAGLILFICQTAFLSSLILLRIYTYFIV